MRRLVPFVLLAAVVPFTLGPAAGGAKRVAFADAGLIIEVNSTDGDAGLQILLDGKPWKRVAIFRPDGQKVFDFRTAGPVSNYGLAELFSESSEPPFEKFPLEQFKALFPEGKYAFTGTTIDGATLRGNARLTHDIPNGPHIVSPQKGERVGRGRAVIRWSAGTNRLGWRSTSFR